MKQILMILLIAISFPTQAKKPSTWIYDQTKGDIVLAENSNITRPIASLTKVMTAMVALDYDSDMSRRIFVGSGSKLPPGMNTRGDLFAALLVRSDNQAAEILAQNYPGGRRAFIQAMNRKAVEVGMTHTKFVDPSGLGAGNTSNVGSVANMLQVASLYPIIADVSVLPQIEIKNQRYRVLLDNTNKGLLARFEEIKLSKTGFTNASGWSVGMILERQGQRFIVVVLGAETKERRYILARDLIQKRFDDIEHDLLAQEAERQYNNNINKSIWQKMKDWWYDRSK
jgi:serine-type D-Ala-D-Ala endopeptidase (penicillin-binding protein 7)